MGATISAQEANRRIQQLLQERFTRGEIARRLGLKRPILELHTDRVKVRTLLKLRRLVRLTVNEPPPEEDRCLTS